MYEEHDGLPAGPPPDLLLGHPHPVPGGGVAAPRHRLQQVPHVDQEAAGQRVSLYPAPLHPLHLQPAQLVLVQEGEGAVVGVLPAPATLPHQEFNNGQIVFTLLWLAGWLGCLVLEGSE